MMSFSILGSVSRLGFLLLVATSGLFGADSHPVARIDFLLRDDIKAEVQNLSEGGHSEEAAWSGTRTIVTKFPVTTIWRSVSVTLHPVTDGRVTVMMMSDDSKTLPPVFIRYDAVSSSNDALLNGGFEKCDKNGNPSNWVLVSDPALELVDGNKASVVTGKAFEGINCIRVWHNSKYVQTIQMTAGKDVTFTFQCRID